MLKYAVNSNIDHMWIIITSVVQAQAQGPKPAEPSPSCQSHHQGFTGPRAWGFIFGSLRLRLQALGVYTDKFSIIFSVERFKIFFNCAISLNNYKRTHCVYFWNHCWWFLSLPVHGISHKWSHGLSPRLGLALAFGGLRLGLGFCWALLKPSLHITNNHWKKNLKN